MIRIETYGCEEVPGIKEEERNDKPEDISRGEGHNQGEENLVLEEIG